MRKVLVLVVLLSEKNYKNYMDVWIKWAKQSS